MQMFDPIHTVDHAKICHIGGFSTFRHNEISDITATLLAERYVNVATESPPQHLSSENPTARSANTDDNVRLDIRARGFWNNSQDAIFHCIGFLLQRTLQSLCRCLQKPRACKESTAKGSAKKSVASSLAISSNGGMCKEGTTFYEGLADMIAQKDKW